jgi:hypothetical protein
MWADEIMTMAYNLLALNASARTFLDKAYVKLVLSADRNNLLPVKEYVSPSFYYWDLECF